MEFELNLLMLEQEDLLNIIKLEKDLYFAYIPDDVQIILGKLPLCNNSGTSYLEYLAKIGARICTTVGSCKEDLEVRKQYKERIEHYVVRLFDPELDPNIRLSNAENMDLQKFTVLEKRTKYNQQQ